MKKWLAGLLALVMVLMAACAMAQGRVFVDDAGREIMLDEQIERVVVTGPLGQIAVFAIAPDKLVGLCSDWDSAAAAYIDAEKYVSPSCEMSFQGLHKRNSS